MFSWRASKVIMIFLSLSVLTIGFLVLWLGISAKQNKFAQAAITGTPLQGWAWADTVGWLAVNCRDLKNVCNNASSSGTKYLQCTSDANCGGGQCVSACSLSGDFFVGVDESTGHLDGYAWSDNVGWIDFNPSWSEITNAGLDTSFYSQCNPGCNTAGDNCSACYNKNNRQFYGWARVLSEASSNNQYDAGWIKLNGTNFDLKVIDETDSQVSGNPKGGAPWGDLLGWVWGGAKAMLNGTPIGPNATSGIGWLSFNCSNPTAGGCANAYRVTGRPDALGTLQINRIDGNDSYGLHIDWSSGYPAYWATSYEVWRQNGRCYYNNGLIAAEEDCDPNVCQSATCSGEPKACHLGALTWGTCNVNSDCYGTCNTTLPYAIKYTTPTGSAWPNQPLALYVTYKYVVRACNIFACSKTAVRNLLTSPVDAIGNFKATPICAATTQSSRIDMSWNRPHIVSFSGANLARYELQYCKLDVGGDISKCGPGLLSEGQGSWENAAADCASPITANLDAGIFRCSENILSSDGRYGSKDFYVYRVRGVANKGTCLGGSKDGQNCGADADCLATPPDNPPGACHFFKSSWKFSNDNKPFRICPVGTSYQEQRPQ